MPTLFTLNRFFPATAILAVALSSACQVADIHVIPARTWTGLSGSVAATDLDDEGALRGSTLDELGIGKRDSNDLLSIEWDHGSDHWERFGHSTDSMGTGVLADHLHLEGEVLLSHEGEVETDLHLGLYGLRWVRPITRRGALEISAGASLVGAEFDLDLDQEVIDAEGVPTGEHKSTGKDAVMPFPLPALDLRYAHESFDARLSLSGLWVWVDDGDGHIIDLDFQIVVPAFDNFGDLVCGYHELEIELDHASDGERARLDVTFSGPYLGLRFGF